MYCIQHCFNFRPSGSTVSEDAGIEPRTAATSALAVRRSNHSARSLPQLDLIHSEHGFYHTVYKLNILSSYRLMLFEIMRKFHEPAEQSIFQKRIEADI